MEKEGSLQTWLLPARCRWFLSDPYIPGYFRAVSGNGASGGGGARWPPRAGFGRKDLRVIRVGSKFWL